MKLKKPEIVPMFKCSSGVPVETLELWKKSELSALIVNSFVSDRKSFGTADEVSSLLLEHAEEIVAILGIVERKGRPVGAKDKKPRKKAALTPTIQHSETSA